MVRDGGLRKLYRKHLPHMHWQSVETPTTGSGVPDSNFCYGNIEGWIENKAVKRSDRVEMRPEQCAWLERRARAGGKCFIAVRWTKADDALYLLKPEAGRLLLAAGLAKLPSTYVLGRWHGGPANWDWPKIGRLLTISR